MNHDPPSYKTGGLNGSNIGLEEPHLTMIQCVSNFRVGDKAKKAKKINIQNPSLAFVETNKSSI